MTGIMNWSAWVTRWLPIAVIGMTLLASLDPLEGFPLVLIGGVLALMAAIQSRSPHTRLIAWGLGLAVVGCAAMVGLSAIGGVGADTGRPLWWLVVVAPYPVGVLLYLAGAVLVLRARWVTAERP